MLLRSKPRPETSRRIEFAPSSTLGRLSAARAPHASSAAHGSRRTCPDRPALPRGGAQTPPPRRKPESSAPAGVFARTETQPQGLETRVVAQTGALPVERVDFAAVDRDHTLARAGDQVLAGFTPSTIAGARTPLACASVLVEPPVHAALVVLARDRRTVVPGGRVALRRAASRRLGTPGGDRRPGVGLSGRPGQRGDAGGPSSASAGGCRRRRPPPIADRRSAREYGRQH